jgi:hypothetical protein
MSRRRQQRQVCIGQDESREGSESRAKRLVDDFVDKRAVFCRDVDLLSLMLARLKRASTDAEADNYAE